MSAIVTAVAVVGVSTYKQIEAQKDAKDASERASRIQQQQFQEEQKKAEIQNLRSVREQIRGARIAQSSMVNQAALSGGTGSSAAAGGAASIGSQLSGNLNYMGQIAASNTAIGNFAASAAQASAEAASASADAAIWGTVGNAAMTGYKIKKG
jgi:hypothetical protein